MIIQKYWNVAMMVSQYDTHFCIHIGFEVMLEMTDSCEINPKESFTTSINKHAPCGFFIFHKFLFDALKDRKVFVRILIASVKFMAYRKTILKDC